MRDGGRLVPDSYVDTMLTLARIYDVRIIYRDLLNRRSWEQRLADEIAYRSLRSRVQRFRRSIGRSPAELHRRLSNAIAALRGEWEASEDDW